MTIFELTPAQTLQLSQVIDLEIGLLHYGTVLGSDVYFSRQYKRDSWRNASDGDKQKLLYQVTQHFELLNYKGSKTVETQLLQFPRGGDTVVPSNIEYAVYEEAYQILIGRDYEQESQNLNIVQHRFGPVSTTYRNGDSTTNNVTAGILSSVAWRLIYPYLRRADEIQIIRV